ncbi:MAG: GIY-YIG nuclease family protein [Patescibacteria group bacterium]
MFTVYVLKGLKNGKRYIGSTGKEALVRLREHNYGSNSWTRQNGPFTLLYTEYYETKTEALKREKFLKSGQGRKWLDEHLGG